jgi:hypothetical protein
VIPLYIAAALMVNMSARGPVRDAVVATSDSLTNFLICRRCGRAALPLLTCCCETPNFHPELLAQREVIKARCERLAETRSKTPGIASLRRAQSLLPSRHART